MKNAIQNKLKWLFANLMELNGMGKEQTRLLTDHLVFLFQITDVWLRYEMNLPLSSEQLWINIQLGCKHICQFCKWNLVLKFSLFPGLVWQQMIREKYTNVQH